MRAKWRMFGGSRLAFAIIGLGIAFVAVILLAARIYRIGLLMYGKRPTLREMKPDWRTLQL